jgi:hypothetical protein
VLNDQQLGQVQSGDEKRRVMRPLSRSRLQNHASMVGAAEKPVRSLNGSTTTSTLYFLGRQRIRDRLTLIDMCITCKYAVRMPVMVQIRNVPSELHRELKARAALEGMSLSDYLLRELRHTLDRPTVEEMRRRLSSRQPVRPRPAPAMAVRRERDSR